MSKCKAALIDFVLKACEDNLGATAAQLKDVFKLSLVAVRQTQKVTPSPEILQRIWPPIEWETLHKKLASSERFKSSIALQTMCQQVVNISQGATVSKQSKLKMKRDSVITRGTSKRKADVSGGEDEIIGTRKAKRKKAKKTNV